MKNKELDASGSGIFPVVEVKGNDKNIQTETEIETENDLVA